MGDYGPLVEATHSRVGADILSGLAHAHEGGIIHCDVKPRNGRLEGHGNPERAGASSSGENPTGELWGGWTIFRQKIVVFRMKIRGRHQTRPPLVKAERAVLDMYDQKSFARAEQSGSIVGVPLRTPAERDGYRRTAGLAQRNLHFHLHDIYPVPEVLAVGG